MCFPFIFVENHDRFVPSFINFCGNSAVVAAGVACLSAVTACALEALGYVAAATSVSVIIPSATSIFVVSAVTGLTALIAYMALAALTSRKV